MYLQQIYRTNFTHEVKENKLCTTKYYESMTAFSVIVGGGGAFFTSEWNICENHEVALNTLGKSQDWLRVTAYFGAKFESQTFDWSPWHSSLSTHSSCKYSTHEKRKSTQIFLKKSARFARTLLSRASLAWLSAPRARDLMDVALRAPIYVIVALRAPTCVNFALSVARFIALSILV